MATSIHVGTAKDPHPDTSNNEVIWLEGDGYYWFLYSYFERAKLNRSNELIDLYDDSEICGPELDQLEAQLTIALKDCELKPSIWNEFIGWTVKPAKGNEIYCEVKKADLHQLIRKFLKLILLAKSNNLGLVVFGD